MNFVSYSQDTKFIDKIFALCTHGWKILYPISFIFNADAKFGNESVVETVLRQDCSERDLRTDLPPDPDMMIEYERKDDVTFIAYCDHEKCNTKYFMETSLKESFSQDEWFLIGSSQGTCFYFLHNQYHLYLLKYW